MSHADALAKVAARYSESSKGPIRSGSRRNLNANEDRDDDSDQKAILKAASSFSDDEQEGESVAKPQGAFRL